MRLSRFRYGSNWFRRHGLAVACDYRGAPIVPSARADGFKTGPTVLTFYLRSHRESEQRLTPLASCQAAGAQIESGRFSRLSK